MADAKRPNILFVLTDHPRPEWVEMNPEMPVRTPHLREEAGYHVMAAGKYHVGNNQSGNPPQLHRGIDGRQGMEEWASPTRSSTQA
jgi:hypothetical protein